MTPAERDNLHRQAKANPSPKAYIGFAVEMARYDNSHIHPVLEYMADEGMTKEQALEQLREDLELGRDDWRRQWAADLEDEGARTNAQLDEAHDEYVRSYLAFAADDEPRRRNPASVMTGPGWSSAREKLRSAARGGKKNPAYDDVHLQRLSDDIARFLLIADRAPEGYTVSWWTQSEESDCAARDYAMVNCETEAYRFSRKIRDLDYAHRMGVIAHEVGHVIAFDEWGDESEDAADRAAAEFLKVRISYDKAYGGKGLQTIRAMTSNPASADEQAEARNLYETFHRYPPTKIGEFARDFSIPRRMLRVGPALWTTYRSGKVDPATLKKPRKPVNYIHEHDAGVDVYVTIEDGADNGWSGTDSPYDDVTEGVEVPMEFQRAQALVKLGDNLGYKFRLGDDEIEAEAEDPLPELYATPDGKCLLVIQDKRDVIAMIWGGALGVFARGIDG